jgi:hypothetical protein
VKLQRLLTNSALAIAFGALALTASFPAYADTTTWTDWNNAVVTSGAGWALGTLGSVNVEYMGPNAGLSGPNSGVNDQYPEGYGPYVGTGYPGTLSPTVADPTWNPASGTAPTWNPSGSWSGGGVTSAPPTSYNSVALNGGSNAPEEITFTNGTVINPLIAIWSLGSSATPASFVFSGASSDVLLLTGGSDAQYGGGSIFVGNGTTQSDCSVALYGASSCSAVAEGSTVTGLEGSGVIEVIGTFGPSTPITFTTPQNENYYAFTVGEGLVPEPETLSLLGLGLLALPLLRASLARRRRA